MTVTDHPYAATQAELVERAKLRQHFGRFDILFFLVCTLVGVDTIGTVAAEGGVAFTWLLVLAVVFFVPSALLFAELGSAFPEEGGPYVWTRLAFGHLAGAVNNFLYWVTNPVWLGGTLAVMAATTVETFFLPEAWTAEGSGWQTWGWWLFTLAFIWGGVLSAVLSFQVGKWIPTVGAWSRFALLGFFTLSVGLYAAQHGVHGIGLGDLNPFTGTSAFFAGLFGLMPVLIFNFVGFELPNSAGDEMKDAQRDVPFGIFRSAVLGVLLYALPILGVLLVLPADRLSGVEGFTDAMKQVFTVYGGQVAADGTVTLTGAGAVLGSVCAVLFVLCLLTSGVTWIMGSDRSLAVSGYDGAAPRWLGVISERFGTPVRVNLFSGFVATVVLVAARLIAGTNAERMFGVVLGLAVSTTLFSYLGVFPALATLRAKFPDVARPYRAPFAKALSWWLSLLLLVASVQLVAPGLGVSWFSGDFLPEGWNPDERWLYLALEAVPLTLFILIGVAFWAAGTPTRRALAASSAAAAPAPTPGLARTDAA